jgi:tetratricopeptide (TPR) repeat protein
MHSTKIKILLLSMLTALLAVFPRYASSQEVTPIDQVNVYKQVIHKATEKIEDNNKDIEAYRVRGLAHYKLGELYRIVYSPVMTKEREEEIFDEFALAAKDFTSVIKLKKDFYTIYLYRGICYGWMEFSESAMKDFDYVIDHDPGNAEAYYLRGKERWRRKEKDQARKDFDKACDLDPKYKGLYYER